MSVLQLNSAGQPLGLVSWFRAVCLLWEGKATLVAGDETQMVNTPRWSTPNPLIIQLDHYVHLKPLKEGRIVKRILLARDNWSCQYCGQSLTEHSATIDHVRPKRLFRAEGREYAANTWDNVVASCGKCNSKKGGRLPRECGMLPRNTPKKPDYVQTMWGGKKYHPIQAEYVASYFRVDVGELTWKNTDNR